MSDDAEPTKDQLQWELDVCRSQAAALLEHHKYVVRLLCIVVILTQVIQLAFFLRGFLAR